MSASHIALTAVGSDRPGIVSEISSIIYEAGCNIEDSRMAILAGEFAVILLFSGNQFSLNRARQALVDKIENELGFHLSFRETSRRSSGGAVQVHELMVSGTDQPGIVQRVSTAIADQGINVAALDSRIGRAAFTGTPLFMLQAYLHVADPPSLAQLNARLEKICEELGLTFSLKLNAE